MITVKDALNSNLVSLSTIFFNIAEDTPDKFVIRSRYKKVNTTQTELNECICKKNNNLISEITGLNFEQTSKSTHTLYIKKETPITFEEFTDQLHAAIQHYRFNTSKTYFDKAILLGAFIPRGSMDFSLNYCAVDMYEKFANQDYVEKILNLLISTNAIDQLNLNFRQLQPQHRKKINQRNTQIRINLKWFNDHFLSEIKHFNLYKYYILLDNQQRISYLTYAKKQKQFLERMVFYIEKILTPDFDLNKMSDKEEKRQIKSLREELDFVEKNNENISKSRNTKITTIANALLPEKCVCCQHKYNIEDRTFKRRGQDKYYFELHHVISFGSNQSGDIIENLVKVCPSCHRALTPNRADEDYQKQLIKNILKNSKVSDKYVRNFVKYPNDLNTKIDYVYANLK
ncbi:HNH endonuclease [Staphylococcus cohnii]|uniref:HNH endonuclease n=1 Tax=Staphylococcus cohnii TaxID=29382 RepID=UPI000E69A986|nr:HNH endonuclease [Staphylococcus cohnii]RIL80754.1 HNH endonuclease [Staphylococcus cohnii]